MQGDLRRPDPRPGGLRCRRLGLGRLSSTSARLSPLRGPYLTTTLGVVSLVTLVAFESMAISTAMPVVAADLHALREYGFVFAAFFTAALFGTVLAGGWCDARGPAGSIRAGLLLFAGGMLVCGLATSATVLVAGRIVAGLGAGLLVVANYVVIAGVYPTQLRPRMFALISAAWVLPGLVGPLIAGFLAQHVSWRAVFLLVPPFVVPPGLALLPTLGTLGADRTGDAVDRRRVLRGLGLALGAGALQWGLGSVTSAPVPASCAALVGLVLIGVTLPALLPPGALRLARGLPTVVVLRGLYAAAYFGVESFVPLMLVTQRGLTPTAAGVVLTGAAVGWTAGSWAQSRPGLRLPRHVLLSLGAFLVGAAMWSMVVIIRPGVPPLSAIGFWAVAAAGMGLAMSSTSVLTLSLSSPQEQGRNSAALQLSDTLGSALGIGLSGAAFATWHRAPGADAALFTGIWLAGGALAVFAGLVARRARA